MNPAQCLRSLLLGGLISASLLGSTQASAQYFGPAFFGFRPGLTVGVGPGVAIGAIPRWSRRAPIYSSRYAPLYPPIGYRGAAVVVPVLPATPLPPTQPYGYAAPNPIQPIEVQSRFSFGPGHIDIQVPGFSYQARRGVAAFPADHPMPPTSMGNGNAHRGHSLGHPALRLADALAQREEGEVWLDYLQPERLATTDNPAELDELALRYQGVMANPDLAWLRGVDGFSETVAWLSQGQAPPNQFAPEPSVAVAEPLTPKSGEPTLAPALPEQEPEAREESSSLETLPAPAPEPTTSL